MPSPFSPMFCKVNVDDHNSCGNGTYYHRRDIYIYILSRLVASFLGEKLGARSTYLYFKVAPKESKNSCGQTKRFLVRRFATLVTSPRPCPPIYRRAARRGSFWNVPSAQGRPPANRAPTRTEAGAAIGRAASTRATPPESIERPWASLIDRARREVAS